MKLANVKNAVKKAAVAVTVAAASATSALAATGIDITADTAQAKSDIGSAGTLIIGVVVAIAAFSWIRRVIK